MESMKTGDDNDEHSQEEPLKLNKPRNPPILFLSTFIIQPIKYLRSLSGDLSPSIIAGIILVYGVSHGFASAFFRIASDYYWKDVQHSHPSTAQFYIGFYYIPWILKPFWGLLTDTVPIAGFYRRPYFIAAGTVGVVSTAVVTAISGLPARWAVVGMVGITASMAIANVTIDAIIARSSIQVKELAADLQSLCGFCSSVGALLGFCTSGFFVHHLGAQGALGLLGLPPASILVLGFFIYEVRMNDTSHFSHKVYERVGSAMEDMFRTIKLGQVWKPSLFMFLSLGLSFSVHEGHFYWYTNPNVGPGFSQEFVGMVYAIGAVGSIMGVVIYHKFLKEFPFRSLLFYAQLIYGLSGMLDLMFILRWNLRLRIPDSLFIIMEESVFHIITKIRWMPMVVLNTRLCPLGIEGTFFALLTCIDSLGSLSSKMIGGIVLHSLHVSRTDFTNLWLAVLIRNCFRFGTLALIFLVPNATQYDVLLPDSDLSAKSGSSLDRNNIEEEMTLQLVPLNEKSDII